MTFVVKIIELPTAVSFSVASSASSTIFVYALGESQSRISLVEILEEFLNQINWQQQQLSKYMTRCPQAGSRREMLKMMEKKR